MNNYAQLNDQNIVVNVIVADQEFIDSLPNSNEYVLLTNGGIGWTYDIADDMFIAPQPYPSWTLDENNIWQPPIPQPPPPPNTYWDENTQTWNIIP